MTVDLLAAARPIVEATERELARLAPDHSAATLAAERLKSHLSAIVAVFLSEECRCGAGGLKNNDLVHMLGWAIAGTLVDVALSISVDNRRDHEISFHFLESFLEAVIRSSAARFKSTMRGLDDANVPLASDESGRLSPAPPFDFRDHLTRARRP